MKLRIHGSSIRFRITQSEMAALVDGARLEDSVQFGPAQTEILNYAVENIASMFRSSRFVFQRGDPSHAPCKLGSGLGKHKPGGDRARPADWKGRGP
jgi:uncharacterized protein DUF7009